MSFGSALLNLTLLFSQNTFSKYIERRKSMSRSKKSPDSDESYQEEEEEYEVEKILKVRVNPKTKKKEYLVKWESRLF